MITRERYGEVDKIERLNGFFEEESYEEENREKRHMFPFGPSNKPSISLVLSPLFRHQVS